MDHKDYMRRALELAAQAAAEGDVPVGCVIVRDGQIIGEGRNRREENGDATAHAELEAIRDACRRLGSWRLLRYGTRDEKAGACGSVLNLFEERFNHHPRLYRGPLEEECRDQLQEFFLDLREKESFSKNV